jgi:hypothetical protein
MSADPHDPRTATADDDLSIIPGLGPVPAPRAEPTGRLDPDRYDPARSERADYPSGPLDLSQDPDRYDPASDVPVGKTLPQLLGEGAHEDERNTYEWAYGLLIVVGFLALVSWFFSSVVSP